MGFAGVALPSDGEGNGACLTIYPFGFVSLKQISIKGNFDFTIIYTGIIQWAPVMVLHQDTIFEVIHSE